MGEQRLNIHLLNALRVSRGDTEPIDLGSPKSKSLFAYLVLHHQQPTDRRRLAFLLWPRGTEAAARRNLRQYLHRIRRALDVIDPDGGLIQTTGNSVQFCPPGSWYLDVAEFEAACTPPDENLARAAELYTGDLLEEVYEDWVEPERDRYARLYRECLLRLIAQREAQERYHEAITYGEQYLTAEPYLESAYVQLMRLHYATRNRGGVKAVFERLQVTFREELGAEPLPETLELYRQMQSGLYAAVTPSAPAPPPRTQTAIVLPKPGAAAQSRPFVGRGSELSWLTHALEQAQEGHGSFRIVQGELGVGKTRLLTEWLAGLTTAVTLFHGQGHEFEAMIPYSPLSQALRTAVQSDINWNLFQPPPPWIDALLPLLPDLPEHLPGYTPGTRGPEHHIIEGVGNFVLTLARSRPVVLFIDNLHWIDAPSWNFLAYLARRAVDAPLLIIGSARAEDMPHERVGFVRKLARHGLVETLPLKRLSQADTYQLVRELMDDTDLEPLFLRRIHEETEGNPFFIIETIQAVREAGGDWTRSVPTDASGQRPHFAIPLQVQAVIESRLDKLSEESRAALGVASAIGREFSFPLLQAVSQTDTQTLLDALDEWLARGLVQETGNGYDFTHEKLSQVAYQQLSRARRQWIHLQIGSYLEQQPAVDPAQLAHHFYASSEPGRALPYLAAAGQRALRVRSYAEAREFGLQAIGLLGRAAAPHKITRVERIDLSLQLAQAYAFTGALPRALEMLQEAERMAEAQGDMVRLTEIFHHSSRLFWLRGRPANADDYARRVLRHAEELDDARLRMAALRMLGRVRIVLGEFDDAIAFLLRYIDLSEEHVLPVDLPAVYGYLGVAYARVGSWQRAIDAAQKGLDLADVVLLGDMHVVARMQLAFVYTQLQEWEAALSVAEPIGAVWQEDGLTPHTFMLRTVIGACLAHTGQPEAGLREIRASLSWAEDVDYRVMSHVSHLYFAQALYQAGEVDAALETAVHAARLAAQIPDPWAEAVALRTQAEADMRRGAPDWLRIEQQLIRARDVLRQIRARPDLARTYLTLRRLYDRAGQSAWAVDCHFRATTIFDELGMQAESSLARGKPGGERTGAVVIPGLELSGPNVSQD